MENEGRTQENQTRGSAKGTAAKTSDAGQSRARRLRQLLEGDETFFLMEAHNGLSAKIVEEAGFDAIWGSGLSISAALGVRDANEASWTQLLDVLEFMTDSSTIPILFDGDTGFGNFNNMRRLVRKLEQRGVAGVCIEDKLFPKTNSLLDGKRQELADVDEFCGRIRAGKDAQRDPDFCIVARVEAFVAGWGLDEAMRRATAYHEAGADAILMHSKKTSPAEVLAFKEAWGDRCPVIIVPTKYYTTPTEVFRTAGFRGIIWANHVMRSAVRAMQETANRIHSDQSLMGVEPNIVSIKEVFRLQGAEELAAAENRYLPVQQRRTVRAVVLAAGAGRALGELTRDRPKAMVPIKGKPLIAHQLDALNANGAMEVTVVRGYKKEAIDLPNLRYVDNEGYEDTREVFSLAAGMEGVQGPVFVTYGDVLFRRHLPAQLLEVDADFVLAVDADWSASRNAGRYADFVTCSQPYRRSDWGHDVSLKAMGAELPNDEIHGEWIGLMLASETGAKILQDGLPRWFPDAALRQARMADVFGALLKAGHDVKVVYTRGDWFDVDDVRDVVDAQAFGGRDA